MDGETLSSIQHHLFPLLSGGHTSLRCLCTKDWLGLVTHHVHLCYLCARVKISREVFNQHVQISISLSVVCTSVSILLNSFHTGCLPIRPSKAADAYEFPVSSSARHQIPQTSTTTTG